MHAGMLGRDEWRHDGGTGRDGTVRCDEMRCEYTCFYGIYDEDENEESVRHQQRPVSSVLNARAGI